MDDSLERFRQVMILSGISSAALGALLLFVTVWRASWRRLLDAEGAFWRRLGLGGSWAGPLRRFEESRAVIFVLAGLLVFHLALLGFAGGAYVYFAPRVRKAQAAHSEQPASNPKPQAPAKAH